jgi:hypothetical protein
MILAAVAVGLLVAYYFGLRAGTYAAAAAGGAFLVAAIVPPFAVIAYVAVGAGVLFTCIAGPKLGTPPKEGALRFIQHLFSRARQLSRMRGKR